MSKIKDIWIVGAACLFSVLLLASLVTAQEDATTAAAETTAAAAAEGATTAAPGDAGATTAAAGATTAAAGATTAAAGDAGATTAATGDTGATTAAPATTAAAGNASGNETGGSGTSATDTKGRNATIMMELSMAGKYSADLANTSSTAYQSNCDNINVMCWGVYGKNDPSFLGCDRCKFESGSIKAWFAVNFMVTDATSATKPTWFITKMDDAVKAGTLKVGDAAVDKSSFKVNLEASGCGEGEKLMKVGDKYQCMSSSATSLRFSFIGAAISAAVVLVTTL